MKFKWFRSHAEKFPEIVRKDEIFATAKTSFDVVLRRGEAGFSLGFIYFDGFFEGERWLDDHNAKELLLRVKPFTKKIFIPSNNQHLARRNSSVPKVRLKSNSRWRAIFVARLENKINSEFDEELYPDPVVNFPASAGNVSVPYFAMAFQKGATGVIARISLNLDAEDAHIFFLKIEQTSRLLRLFAELANIVGDEPSAVTQADELLNRLKRRYPPE